MAPLVRLSFVLACTFFVLSLPLGPAGKGLRKAAAFLFLLALTPALVVGLATGGAQGPGWNAPDLDFLEWIGLFTVLSVTAAGILAIRKRLGRQGRDAWSEWVSQRSSGKQPIERPAPPSDDEDLP